MRLGRRRAHAAGNHQRLQRCIGERRLPTHHQRPRRHRALRRRLDRGRGTAQRRRCLPTQFPGRQSQEGLGWTGLHGADRRRRLRLRQLGHGSRCGDQGRPLVVLRSDGQLHSGETIGRRGAGEREAVVHARPRVRPRMPQSVVEAEVLEPVHHARSQSPARTQRNDTVGGRQCCVGSRHRRLVDSRARVTDTRVVLRRHRSWRVSRVHPWSLHNTS